MEIIFEHSAWWLLPMAAVAALLSWWYYLQGSAYQEWSKGFKTTLAVLRFLWLMLLVFFLLKPFVKSTEVEEERPILVMAIDDSESIAQDSAQSLDFAAQWDDLTEELSEKFDVRSARFGNELKTEGTPTFEQKASNAETLIDHVNQSYFHRNLSAVVVASDGIFNRGADPRFVSFSESPMLYTVGLGDTTVLRDLEVSRVKHNQLVFRGNRFEVRILLQAKKMNGEAQMLTISQNGKQVHEQEVPVKGDEYYKELSVVLPSSESGLQRYSVRWQPAEGEPNTQNNALDFFIDILDNRTKVLMLGSAAHPDIGAISSALANSDQYEVEVVKASDFEADLKSYDMVIAHQLPGRGAAIKDIISRASALKLPLWTIVGIDSDLGAIANSALDISISGGRQRFHEVGGALNREFGLFQAPDISKMDRYPPLMAPFGDYAAGSWAEVLMYQRIGTVSTEIPLWAFRDDNGTKQAILLAEGLWRWRLHSYSQNQSFEEIDDLIKKTVQYLSLRENRDQLRIDAPRKIEEGMPLVLGAELYNKTLELTNEAEVRFEIEDSLGNVLDYQFKPQGKSYQLSIKDLAEGEYSWRAIADLAGERLAQTGFFAVNPLQLENRQLVANHQLLAEWAASNAGQYFEANALSTLRDSLMAMDAPVVLHYSDTSKELIDWKWFCFAIALLAGLEWFLRKRYGYY